MSDMHYQYLMLVLTVTNIYCSVVFFVLCLNMGKISDILFQKKMLSPTIKLVAQGLGLVLGPGLGDVFHSLNCYEEYS